MPDRDLLSGLRAPAPGLRFFCCQLAVWLIGFCSLLAVMLWLLNCVHVCVNTQVQCKPLVGSVPWLEAARTTRGHPRVGCPAVNRHIVL